MKCNSITCYSVSAFEQQTKTKLLVLRLASLLFLEDDSPPLLPEFENHVSCLIRF